MCATHRRRFALVSIFRSTPSRARPVVRRVQQRVFRSGGSSSGGASSSRRGGRRSGFCTAAGPPGRGHRMASTSLRWASPVTSCTAVAQRSVSGRIPRDRWRRPRRWRPAGEGAPTDRAARQHARPADPARCRRSDPTTAGWPGGHRAARARSRTTSDHAGGCSPARCPQDAARRQSIGQPWIVSGAGASPARRGADRDEALHVLVRRAVVPAIAGHSSVPLDGVVAPTAASTR